jgi:DNA-binding transcriptional MerR regulator
MSSETFYNITQAANATGKSNPTIRKYLREGKLPNAIESSNGNAKTVSIPLTDLVAAGLMDTVSSAPQTPQDPIRELIDQVQETRESLARVQLELELTKERLADYKNFVQLQQRQIETQLVQIQRRRFWQRSKPSQPPTDTL